MREILSNGYSWESHYATGIYTGRGEFYSGIRTGAEVLVRRVTNYRPDGTVNMGSRYTVSAGGAHLYVSPADVTLTSEWV